MVGQWWHKLEGVNQCLIWSKAHSMKKNPYWIMLRKPRNRDWISQQPRLKPNTTVLKKSINQSLMIFCYSHKSVPYPVITREAASWSRWEEIQKPNARHYVERESKLMVSIKLLPAELGSFFQFMIHFSKFKSNQILYWVYISFR